MSAEILPSNSIAQAEAEYRQAFAAYAAEVNNLQRLLESRPSDASSRDEALERVRAAERTYREKRDQLMQVLLTASNRDANIRSVARAIWERAGRPAGTAESDWFRAERILLASSQA